MNTYTKFYPNVFVAKSTERYEKGDVIEMTTKYGKTHDVEVWNCVGKTNDGYFLYSITRCDGMNAQERAKRKAEKLQNASMRAEKRSNEEWQKSHEGRDFLVLAEPIKIGHHSEKRHRALIERNHNRMNKSVEFQKVAETYEQRAKYWESKTEEINLSMPESIEYFEFKLEEAKMKHEGLKNGTIEKSHSFSLTYAKKEVNNMQEKYDLAIRLWQ
jgi:hypothetical protein